MSTLAITGVTGFLGSAVAREAHKAGHRVIGYSRDAQRAEGTPGVSEGRCLTMGETPDFAGVDAVIHLAGETVFGLWSPAKKHRIMASRKEGTRAVVRGIAAVARPLPLIATSGAGYYGDTGEFTADESAPQGSGFLTEVCREWEAQSLAAERLGSRVVILRSGLILDESGGMLAKLRPLFRFGLGGTLGSGAQWMAWISLRDMVRLILACVENESARGVYNAVSPTPVRNLDFTQAMAKRWGVKARFPVPEIALRALPGGLGEMILQSQRVLPRRTLALPFSYETESLEAL